MNFNPLLKSIENYESGKPIELVVRQFGISPEKIIKLASNENPNGPSPLAIEAIKNHANLANLYPDDSAFALKEDLSSFYGLKSEEVIIGRGSDEIIELCTQAKGVEGDCVLMAKTTFAMYEKYAIKSRLKVIKTPSHQHNLEEFLTLYKKHKPSIIFLCVPNNPLGECLKKEAVWDFLKQIDSNTLVVFDGAYQEYANYKLAKDGEKPYNVKELLGSFPNLIYLGTFSKAYGLGGMRVGYGLAKNTIISALSKMRSPFNVTNLSLLAAQSALKDKEFVKSSIEDNFIQMETYYNFARKHGLAFMPSYTNFVVLLCGYEKDVMIEGLESMQQHNLDSTALSDWLLSKGVIVRNLRAYGLNAIRVTIGRAWQNERLFELVSEYLTTLKKG